MRRLFLVYLLPIAFVNLGNLFAYLFQFLLSHTLTTNDVGAFNALMALTNILSAPASIVPFVLSRAIIATEGSGAERFVVQRSAWTGAVIAVILVAIGWLVLEPLRQWLQLDHRQTALLGFVLLAASMIHPIAVGWLQGMGRYVTVSVALGGVPTLRFLLGLGLVLAAAGGIDAALISAAAPGLIVFVTILWSIRSLPVDPHPQLPDGLWRELALLAVPFMMSALLILAFWNLDVVFVRTFWPADSGPYSFASVLGRIPFLISAALANILFPETLRAGRSNKGGEGARLRLLGLNLIFAAILAFGSAVLLAVFAEPLLVTLGGIAYRSGTPILQVLSFAMAELALLQLVVTYAMARQYYGVYVPLLLGVGTFAGLATLMAEDPRSIAIYLAGTIFVVLAMCICLVLLRELLPRPVHASSSS